MSLRKSGEPHQHDAACGCGDEVVVQRVAEKDEKIVVPVVEEQLEVHKRTVDTGSVRICKVVQEREQVVDVPLEGEELSVERVAVDRFVKGPLEVRTEGDTTIIPVVEEVVVVERRWKLKEELRVTRRRRTVSEPQRVTLRREEAVVERLGKNGAVSQVETVISGKPDKQRS